MTPQRPAVVTVAPIVVDGRWRTARTVDGVVTVLCEACGGHGTPGDAARCFVLAAALVEVPV